jgi:hypothetical protein
MGSLTLVALLAIFIGFWQYSETLIGTIDRQANDLAETREHIRILNKVLDIAQSQNVQIHDLQNAGGSQYPKGKVLWNPLTREAALQLDRLAPSDKPYHLWMVANKKPVVSRSFTIADRDTISVWRVFDFDQRDPSADSFVVTAGDSTEAFSVLLTSSPG